MESQLPKGNGLGRTGGKGGISGKRGIMISIHNVCGGGTTRERQFNTDK